MIGGHYVIPTDLDTYEVCMCFDIVDGSPIVKLKDGRLLKGKCIKEKGFYKGIHVEEGHIVWEPYNPAG